MISSFLPFTIWALTTDLLVNLIFAVVFPLIVIGLGIKFMRNIDKV